MFVDSLRSLHHSCEADKGPLTASLPTPLLSPLPTTLYAPLSASQSQVEPRSIALTLNGESRVVAATNVAELLVELNLQGKRVALERNRALVSRDTYEQTLLQSGDAIEIVTFVGGG